MGLFSRESKYHAVISGDPAHGWAARRSRAGTIFALQRDDGYQFEACRVLGCCADAVLRRRRVGHRRGAPVEDRHGIRRVHRTGEGGLLASRSSRRRCFRFATSAPGAPPLRVVQLWRDGVITKVSGGLIHHWAGTTFVPEVDLDRVVFHQSIDGKVDFNRAPVSVADHRVEWMAPA